MNLVSLTKVMVLALLLMASKAGLSAVVLVPADVLSDYKLLVNKRSPASIKDFSGEGSRREVIEVILLLQALDEGDYRRDIRLRTSPSIAQSMRLLASGEAHLLGTTQWKQSLGKFESRINPSFKLIRSGEYQLGIYGCQGQVTGPAPDLSNISLVADKNQSMVWSALQQAGFKSLDSFDAPAARSRMVCLARVQATVEEFPQSSHLTITREGFSLEPFAGVKLVIEGSRHYAMSNSASYSESVAIAVNRGLRVLRRKGVVRRALLQSGLDHPKAKDWKEIRLTPAK